MNPVKDTSKKQLQSKTGAKTQKLTVPNRMKTYSAKPTEVTRKWYVIDASDATLGRVSTVVAKLLIGKDKPNYTPHVDSGDNVIVINAANLTVTGQKFSKKIYYRHSGYPGNLRHKSLNQQVSIAPEKVIQKAVRGMLPVNKLRPGRLARLKVYGDSEHPHSAQNPEKLSVRGSK